MLRTVWWDYGGRGTPSGASSELDMGEGVEGSCLWNKEEERRRGGGGRRGNPSCFGCCLTPFASALVLDRGSDSPDCKYAGHNDTRCVMSVGLV